MSRSVIVSLVSEPTTPPKVELTDEEIFSFLRLLLPAGVETTYRSLGNLLFALLTDTTQLDAIRADRSLLPQAIEEAVRAAKTGEQPIRLLVKDMDVYRTLAIDYHDGLRYPTLERIEGSTDYLTPIFSARK